MSSHSKQVGASVGRRSLVIGGVGLPVGLLMSLPPSKPCPVSLFLMLFFNDFPSDLDDLRFFSRRLFVLRVRALPSVPEVDSIEEQSFVRKSIATAWATISCSVRMAMILFCRVVRATRPKNDYRLQSLPSKYIFSFACIVRKSGTLQISTPLKLMIKRK